MIRYALRCRKGHAFEGWFRSSEDFASTRTACPVCGSTKVEKGVMAPQVARTDREAPIPMPAPAAKPVPLQLAAADPRRREMIAALRELRAKVTENADYVGDKFAEEARKIHYGETDPRGIYGQATPEEAETLAEEGIDFHPLPILPEDRN
jgi:hypothetical protein